MMTSAAESLDPHGAGAFEHGQDRQPNGSPNGVRTRASTSRVRPRGSTDSMPFA